MNSKPGLVVAIGEKPEGKDDMDSPTPDLDDASQTSNVVSVPLDALAMPDDQEQMTPPEVGDEVNWQSVGKVVAIEGNMAKVQLSSINGQDVSDNDEDDKDEAQSPDDSAPAGGDDDDDLQKEASGIGLMSIVIAFLMLFAASASAQNAGIQTPFTPSSTGTVLTNAFVVTKQQGTRIYNIQGFNTNTAAVTVMLFHTNGVPANGVAPLLTTSAPAGGNYKFDFGATGAAFDACVVCVSTTSNTLTLDTTHNVSIVSVQSNR